MKIALLCSECGSRNYHIKKTAEKDGSRISVKKFCKQCNRHTIHKSSI
ncbi:50S ribosomal protein L33 [Nosocomiicoccus ampullae]|nr:50S ribosomal protein L33 [Nosocomiicoccus ampullae]QYA48347.1 50S ribosomal protein L33 [Nosocomiicoccus ampullae]HJB79327.1 50S ribosomal protein L33 [Candidatus Nosocomiicoccus stercorigallinarum]